MKKVVVLSVLALLVVGGAVSISAAEGGKPDGKALFLAQKCNMCHAVSVAEVPQTGKGKPSDLSTIGKDAAWVEKYLKKEVDIEGKKHGPAFKGTPEELKAVAGWIAAQQKKK